MAAPARPHTMLHHYIHITTRYIITLITRSGVKYLSVLKCFVPPPHLTTVGVGNYSMQAAESEAPCNAADAEVECSACSPHGYTAGWLAALLSHY